MYPKNSPDADSAVPISKEETFMNRLYLKVEAICVEADKSLIQGASKYVETQVSTVSSSMKKLCGDFIRDLLPPPEEELRECRHVEKCQCKAGCDSQAQEDQHPQLAVAAAAAAQVADASDFQHPQVAGAPVPASVVATFSETADERTDEKVAKTREEACCSPEVAECDTIVEEGDQAARWYESDEDKRSKLLASLANNSSKNKLKASHSSSGFDSETDEWELV